VLNSGIWRKDIGYERLQWIMESFLTSAAKRKSKMSWLSFDEVDGVVGDGRESSTGSLFSLVGELIPRWGTGPFDGTARSPDPSGWGRFRVRTHRRRSAAGSSSKSPNLVATVQSGISEWEWGYAGR
jgi:hypothetical protein